MEQQDLQGPQDHKVFKALQVQQAPRVFRVRLVPAHKEPQVQLAHRVFRVRLVL